MNGIHGPNQRIEIATLILDQQKLTRIIRNTRDETLRNDEPPRRVCVRNVPRRRSLERVLVCEYAVPRNEKPRETTALVSKSVMASCPEYAGAMFRGRTQRASTVRGGTLRSRTCKGVAPHGHMGVSPCGAVVVRVTGVVTRVGESCVAAERTD